MTKPNWPCMPDCAERSATCRLECEKYKAYEAEYLSEHSGPYKFKPMFEPDNMTAYRKRFHTPIYNSQAKW